MDSQVGVPIKVVDKSVGVFGLTAAVGANNTAGDEVTDADDTAVVRHVSVVPDDFTVNVDSAVKVFI